MPRRRTVRAPLPTQRGGLRRIALWSVASLAAFALLWTLVLGAWLPRFLQPRLEAAASAALGAPFAIGRLEIAPWRLAVVASDLRLGPQASPWLRVARVEADASSASFLRLAPVIERLRVIEPAIAIERLAPGRFNVSPLLEALARRPAAPAEAEPQRFALHNLSLEGGTARFADRVAKSEHAVEALHIGVPFLSNLPADVAVDVEPLLAARIDGSPLRLSGRTQPFSAGRRSSIDIDWRDVDLARWLEALAPWLPPALPLELQRGRLAATLRVVFEQRDAALVPLLQVGGSVALTEVEVHLPALGLGLVSPRLEFEGLDLRPLERRASLGRIRWPGPAVEIDLPILTGRAPVAAGLEPASTAGAASAPAPAASASASASGRVRPSASGAASPSASGSAALARGRAAPSPSGGAGDGGWQWRVGTVELTEGRVRLSDPGWPDGRVLGPVSLQVEDLESGADANPARLALALADADGTRLAVEGGLSPGRRAAQLEVDLSGLRLPPWLAPWQAVLPVRLLDGALALQAALDAGPTGWSLRDGVVKVEALKVEPVGATAHAASAPAREPRRVARRRAGPGGGVPTDRLVLAALEAGGLQFEGGAGEAPVVRVERLALEGLDAHALRRADGALAWLGSGPAGASGPVAPRAAAAPQGGSRSENAPQSADGSRSHDAPKSADRSQEQHASQSPDAPRSPGGLPSIDGPRSPGGSPAAADATSRSTTAPTPAAQAAQAAPAWRIGELRCTGCSITFHDASQRPAASFGLKDARLVLHEVGADPARALGFELAGQSLGGGRLRATGRVRPQPLDLHGRLDVEALDLRRLQPYLAPHLNVALASARAHAGGELRVEGDARRTVAAARWRGRLALADLRALDRHNDTDFMRWRSLQLDGSDLRWTPARVEADLGRVSLDGFYGRVIVNPDGRLNLLDIVRREGETGERSITTPAAAGSSPLGGNAGTSPGAAGEPSGRDAATALAASGSAAAPSASIAAPFAPSGPRLRWQAIRVADSAVDFTDHFIRPNYDARLVQLDGEVAGLAWDDPQPAALRLSGKVDGSAPLEIAGSVHPLGPRLATDITASARGIDITRLSGYSGRYAGYGIEKGTLSLQVHYKLDNGQLEAQNKLYLDQLTFGGKVDSPDALKLPVLLAVSLLKDRNGVIDIDLPIRGSLDDPQFSIGGIIVRVIVNLVTKAVTAPFSLLARAFGAGEELGHVDFAPGSSELDDAARARLDKLAQALAERPALRLEATGRADPAVDEAALRRRHVERLLRVAKARERGDLPDGVAIEPAERARWLEAAYKAADLPAKPRNVLGLAKSLRPQEMEALLLDSAPGGEAALRALADQRGDRVKAYLVGKIAPERVLLSASRVGAAAPAASRAGAAGAREAGPGGPADVAKASAGAEGAAAGHVAHGAGSTASAAGAGTSDAAAGSMASGASASEASGASGPSGPPGAVVDPASGPRVDFTLK